MSKQASKTRRPGQLTLAQARSGKGIDVDVLVSDLASRTDELRKADGTLSYDTALAFNAVVRVGKTMKQGEFIAAVGIESKSSGTMYSRLADVATRLGVRHTSNIWRVVSQNSSHPRVIEALKIEVPAASKAALQVLADEYDKAKTLTVGGRTPARPDEGEGTGSGEGSDGHTPDQTPAPVDIGKTLDVLDRWLKDLKNSPDTHGEWTKVRDRMRAIDTRESNRRKVVDAKVREAAKAAENAA